MATRIQGGPRKWGGGRDSEGYRTYFITFRVIGDTTDGPANAMRTPGLPAPGDPWNFDGDSDPDCYCTQEIKPEMFGVKEGNPSKHWDLTYTFTNKPVTSKRCHEDQIDDPLQKPMSISGGFTKAQEEITRDRFGFPVVNSAHEQIRGPQTEFDSSRDQVKIEQNVARLELALVESMKDTVNGLPMWGMPPRTIKLSNFTFRKEFYGKCSAYFVRMFEFEVRNDGWDRNLLDEGTKVLNGHFDTATGNYVLDNIAGNPPNRRNPQHFIRFKDKKGENCRVILNGFGVPAGVITGTSKFFMSIAAGNLDNPVSNEEKWVPFPDEPSGVIVFDWAVETSYKMGDVVRALDANGTVDGYYVCIIYGVIGHSQADSPIGSDEWAKISPPLSFVEPRDQTLDKIAVNRGNWSNVVTYAAGQYVKDSSNLGPGSIHVEKYAESDFRVLGIPTDLEA